MPENASLVKLAVVALLVFAVFTIAFVPVVIGRQHDVEQLHARLGHQQATTRELKALACVLAHVDEPGERITIGLQRAGQFDAREYRADYPDC